MNHSEILAKIDRLRAHPPGLHGRDFLLTWRESETTLRFLLGAAEALEEIHRAGLSARLFDTGLGLSLIHISEPTRPY